VAKRAHLQAFIDRWRYNANRAAQAQSKIKELERMPEVEEPEKDEVVRFKLPETEKLAPPLLQVSMSEGCAALRLLMRCAPARQRHVRLHGRQDSAARRQVSSRNALRNCAHAHAIYSFDVTMESRIAVVGSNGAGEQLRTSYASLIG
jgi:ATPase subunit of ABC transporter with duplicated ATPase domains